jgi:hypothetical protein
MRKLLFNYSLYSHPEIRKFQGVTVRQGAQVLSVANVSARPCPELLEVFPLPRIRGDNRVGSLLGYLNSLRRIYCRYMRDCHSFVVSEGIWQLICNTLQMYYPPNFQFRFTGVWV